MIAVFVLMVGGFLLVMWRRPRSGKDSDEPRGGDPNADTRSHGPV